MPDPGLYDPETGEWFAVCPRCGIAIVKPGFWCEPCTSDYRAENEFLDADSSLQRDAELADAGFETTVEPSEDAA